MERCIKGNEFFQLKLGTDTSDKVVVSMSISPLTTGYPLSFILQRYSTGCVGHCTLSVIPPLKPGHRSPLPVPGEQPVQQPAFCTQYSLSGGEEETSRPRGGIELG